MYCKYCGKEIESEVKFCSNCGKSVVYTENNGLAIVSLVLGILSIIFYGLAIFQILAIIFSLIALIKIKNQRATGKKIAIIGLILGIIYTVHFCNKVFLKTDYFKHLYNTLSKQENSIANKINNDLRQKELLGTWMAHNSTDDEISMFITVVLEEDKFTLINEVNSSETGELLGYSEFSGSVGYFTNFVLLYIQEYSEKSTMPVDTVLGTTRMLTIKGDKLYDNIIEFNKIK